jgi:hypothetical protein
MTNNTIEIALTAMNHPHGWDILNAIRELTQNNQERKDNPPLLNAESIDVNAELIDNSRSIQLPRYHELQQKGIDIQSSSLNEVACQYQDRLDTAINAWLKWASHTIVQYPTSSLIRAIEQNWQP